MASGASVQRAFKSAGSRLHLYRILALLVIFASTPGFAQQTTPSHGNTAQPAKISPLLQEAEEFGRVALHIFDSVTDILLLVDSQFDEVGCVIYAARVGVDHGVEAIGAM